ncbi:D-alanyl-D-alanine carboxypeptidase [Dethiosulfatibacter aminovorans DSM 17477]|uniref:D-alanyl-D-alanine carboxypeptidase n=1 Tax=Dethiosulfatibacter aminovorans DSM 17477 TaxID=1121476 RepID=A0A1M6KWB7_9FIRM|nr:M15 family metallopeptidase [Dethiosulfatibacter aminovorans]SHJ63261.1 D-alanyl-D-alanine carboxypeptidase [Dethiosulfatibacter aminovorans DSM 17477]
MGMKIRIIGLCLVAMLSMSGCGNGHSDVESSNDAQPLEAVEIIVDGSTASRNETVDIVVEAIFEDGERQTVTGGFVISTDLIVEGENSVIIPGDALTGEDFEIAVEYEGVGDKKSIKVVNLLSETIDDEGIITNPEALDMVVNKQRTLPSDYVPEDLVKVEVETCLPNEEINQLREVASDALTRMFEGAEADGFTLVARSGYRSYNTQTALYNGYVSRHGQEYADKYSALPGQSEHQSGLAMDITAQSVGLQLEDYFGDTDEGKWVSEHAHEYGFIIRYPLGMEDITGYLYEPWHLRYLGVDLATEVYESGLTLEEYFMSFE